MDSRNPNEFKCPGHGDRTDRLTDKKKYKERLDWTTACAISLSVIWADYQPMFGIKRSVISYGSYGPHMAGILKNINDF